MINEKRLKEVKGRFQEKKLQCDEAQEVYGELVAELIRENGESQENVARLIQVSPSALSKVINNNANPSPSYTFGIANALGLDVEDEKLLHSARTAVLCAKDASEYLGIAISNLSCNGAQWSQEEIEVFYKRTLSVCRIMIEPCRNYLAKPLRRKV